jgi:hypothetical protein
MNALFFPADSHRPVDLYGLGDRCLHEPSSRRLDGEIYCALHDVKDFNPLANDRLLLARERGEVLVQPCSTAGLVWIEVPLFTAELKHAKSLLPKGLMTFFHDARRVCATALQARALTNEPPPSISHHVQLRRG